MRKNSVLFALCIFVFLAAVAFADNDIWDKKFGKGRFVVLSAFNNEAVLDKETGLVWERSPTDVGETLPLAHFQCTNLIKGDRWGWRLPTIEELTSLLDPTQQEPALPQDHPFENVTLFDIYWSATRFSLIDDRAWAVGFGADPGPRLVDVKSDQLFWCVRGGQGVDVQ